MSGSGPFRVVRIYDPAINHDASDLGKYVRDRSPEALDALVFYDGEKPTVFHCRPLTVQERRDVRNKSTDSDRFEAAFVRGLVRVDSLVDRNGGVREWNRGERKDGKPMPITDDDLELLFCEADVQEVGSVIWSKSILFFHKGFVGSYPLPPTSLAALAAMSRLHVAPTKSLPSSPSDKHSPEEPPPEDR